MKAEDLKSVKENDIVYVIEEFAHILDKDYTAKRYIVIPKTVYEVDYTDGVCYLYTIEDVCYAFDEGNDFENKHLHKTKNNAISEAKEMNWWAKSEVRRDIDNDISKWNRIQDRIREWDTDEGIYLE